MVAAAAVSASDEPQDVLADEAITQRRFSDRAQLGQRRCLERLTWLVVPYGEAPL